jgi:hypothetical protein
MRQIYLWRDGWLVEKAQRQQAVLLTRSASQPHVSGGVSREHSAPEAQHMTELLSHFDWPAGDLSAELDTALAAVAECRQMLQRPERRITFFGVFKAGKSTILNALVGRDILPTRANRATGVVTRLSYSVKADAWLGC